MPGSMPKMTRRTFLGLAAGAATSAVLCRPEAAMAADVDWSGEPVATDAAGEETLEHARWRMENDLPSSFRYDEGKPVAEPDSGATTTVNGPRHAPSASGTPAVSRTGIDVSYAQGTIDWDKAKADGVEFAILRSSYAFWRDSSASYVKKADDQFVRNVQECERVGMPYGVYHYTYAENAAQAKADAQLVLDLLGGHVPSLPIFYDIEDQYLLTAKVDMDVIASSFCGYLEERGYEAGVYAAMSWFKYYMTDPIHEQWVRWVAQIPKLTYEGRCRYWQHSWERHVDGIVDWQGTSIDVDEDYDLSTMSFSRVAGMGALDTMEAVVYKDDVFAANRGGNVIVATADGYWDALSVAGMAGILDAPIVTTSTSALSDQASRALQRLKPSKVVVVGGVNAVNDRVLEGIKTVTGVKPERVWGPAADDTAVEVYKSATGWSETCIVATSKDYMDALSAAPYAYAKHAPIFLTNWTTNTLSDATLQAMAAGKFTRVLVVGGPDAVPKSEYERIRTATGTDPKVIYGQSALDTSREFAAFELSEGMGIDHMAIATNNGYWDALAAAPLVGKQNSILVLVDTRTANYTALDAVFSRSTGGVTSGYVVGGTAAVQSGVWNRL